MARRTSVVSSPLKLPKAPKGYDERDQDHTRRLIELALIAYTQQLSGVINDIATQNVFGRRYDPISPVHGMVNTVGTAGTAPYIQILNPPGSGKILVLYELMLSQEGASTACRARTTQIPADLSGVAAVVTSAFLEHRDSRDVTAISGTLKGTTTINGTPFGALGANWQDIIESVTGSPWAQGKWIFGRGAQTIHPGMGAVSYGNHQPIILQPGDAFEIVGTTNGTAIALRAYAAWDELPLTAVVGVTDLIDPSAPISSCWGMIFGQIGSVNAGSFIQLLNPGPKIAKITQLDVLANSASYAQVYRTSVPAAHGAGAVLTTGLVQRMARRDLLAVQCRVTGSTFAQAQGGNRLIWRDKGRYTLGLPYEQIVGSYSAPLYLMPGEALEMQNEALNNIPISMRVFWDEIDSIH